MAIIKCPKCGFDISDKSKECINCGCKLESMTNRSFALFGENSGKILLECVNCKKVYSVSKESFSFSSKELCISKNKFTCPQCGGGANAGEIIREKKCVLPTEPYRAGKNDALAYRQQSNVVRCPKCGSTSIQIMKQGPSVAGALLGAAIWAPLALIGAFGDSNKVIRVCLNCKHKF